MKITAEQKKKCLTSLESYLTNEDTGTIMQRAKHTILRICVPGHIPPPVKWVGSVETYDEVTEGVIRLLHNAKWRKKNATALCVLVGEVVDYPVYPFSTAVLLALPEVIANLCEIADGPTVNFTEPQITHSEPVVSTTE